MRRLLAEMLHQAFDAISADIIEGLQVQSKKRGSAASNETAKRTSRPADGKGKHDEVMGVMSEDEELARPLGDDEKAKDLGKMVEEEMEEMSEVVKEAIDDALW